MARAKFEIVSVSLSDAGQTVLIADRNGPVSVTNDAEAVVKEVLEWRREQTVMKGELKIHYLDSEGRRDELCHDGEKFTGFAPVDP